MIETTIRDLLADIAATAVDQHPHPDVLARVRRRRLRNAGVSVLVIAALLAGGVGGVVAFGRVRRAEPAATRCQDSPRRIATTYPPEISDVDTSGDDIWAIGSMAKLPTVRTISSPQPGVEIIKGPENDPKNILLRVAGDAEWDMLPAPPKANGTQLHFSVIAPDDIWVVGSTSSDGGKHEPLVQHWNGSTWTQVEVPHGLGTYDLRAVDGVATDDVWFAGATFNSDPASTILMHWDGTVIRRVDAPSPESTSVTLERVLAIASNDVWAIGGGDRPIALHWDGVTWSETQVPESQVPKTQMPDGSRRLDGMTMDAIALAPDGDLIGVGSQWTGPVTSHVVVMRYHAGQWTMIEAPQMDNGREAAIGDLAVTDDGTIWIAGTTRSDGATMGTLASWNGSTWSLERIPEIQTLSLIVAQGTQVAAFGVTASGVHVAQQYDAFIVRRCAS